MTTNDKPVRIFTEKLLNLLNERGAKKIVCFVPNADATSNRMLGISVKRWLETVMHPSKEKEIVVKGSFDECISCTTAQQENGVFAVCCVDFRHSNIITGEKEGESRFGWFFYRAPYFLDGSETAMWVGIV